MVKPEECRCCMETEQCHKMFDHEDGESQKCISDHPGFNDVCLNEWVLETASLGLKTKGRRNYASVTTDFTCCISFRTLSIKNRKRA